MIDNTTKREIIIKEYSRVDNLSLITVGWKKIDTKDILGDYIVLTKDEVVVLVEKLKEILQ